MRNKYLKKHNPINFKEQLYLKNVVMIGNQKYYLNEEYNEMKTSLVSNILHDLLA